MSCILPLVFLAWLPLTAYGSTSSHTLKKTLLIVPGTVTPTPVSTTPTPDATMTELQKEQLTQQVDQLKDTNERSFGAWLWNNGSLLGILVTIAFGLYQYLRNLRNEQRRRIEDSFQAVITNLAGEQVETKVGAAIMLRTFLAPAYKRFHVQVFDLVVACLRSQKSTDPGASPASISPVLTALATNISRTQQADKQLPSSLNQALAVVFKEALPLARQQLKKYLPSYKVRIIDVSNKQKWSLQLALKQLRDRFKKYPGIFKSQDLDATGIQLENAYLAGADLNEVWLPGGSLAGANLIRTELNHANLAGTDLTGAQMNVAELNGTNLRGAILTGANLAGAELIDVQFADAYLEKADFTGADLTGANPEEAKTLKGAILRDVVGLSDPQRLACRHLHAIVEDS
ncbi:MAG TPA: pentapeptide repeat-containing protein [Ktedonobacteraceae bacterium]|nr:pentapeptide repeat-containing protein [Ktedonobacteraceae bacterium]